MITAALPTWAIIVISVVGAILLIFIVLMILGQKMQKKQQASEADIQAASQVMSMLIIDKKKLKPQDANLPKAVAEQIPKYMRFAKLPIVKAKVGPRIMTLIADAKVFDNLPVKTEVKVAVSGLYITEIKYVRGKVEMPKKKSGPLKRLAMKARDAQKAQTAQQNKKKK